MLRLLQARQEQPAQQEPQVRQELKEQQEQPALQDHQEQQVRQEQRELRAEQDLPVLLVLVEMEEEHQVIGTETVVLLEAQADPAVLVDQGVPAVKVEQEGLEAQAVPVAQVHQEHPEALVVQGKQAEFLFKQIQ